MIRYVLLLIGIGVVFLTSSADAVTLTETLQEILTTHPRIQERLKIYNASVHEMENAETGKRPTISLDAEGGHDEVRNSSNRYRRSDSTISGARVVARQLLTDGKRIAHDVRAREALARAALFSYVESTNEVAYESIEAYINVQKTMELLRLGLENVEIHRRLLASIRARVVSGSAGNSELERVQGRLAAAESTLIVRENEYKRSIYALHKFLGRFVDGRDLVMPNFPGELIPSALDQALTRQRENHPSLVAADFNIRSKDWEFHRERVSLHPSLFLEVNSDWRKGYNGIQGEDVDNQALFKMSIPLVDGGARRSRMEQFKSLIHREKYVRDNVARTLFNDLALTWTGYHLLNTQIGALQKSIFFTQQALRSYQEEFKLGKRLLINILDAESEFQNARAVLASVRYDLLASKYRLLFSMGTLIEDLGLKIPLARQLGEAKRLRPAGQDRLPPKPDLDMDGISDKLDISVNSLASDVVNSFGETPARMSDYVSAPSPAVTDQEPGARLQESDSQPGTIKPDFPTELESVTFEKNSIEVSSPSMVILGEVMEHLKRQSADGLITLTVTEEAAASPWESVLLALQRAYNVKKIMTTQNIDPDSILVTPQPGIGIQSEAALFITVNTRMANFRDRAEVLSDLDLRFPATGTALLNVGREKLAAVAERFKRIPHATLDIVAFSNDAESAPANMELATARADAIRQELIQKGCPAGNLYPIAWGSYEDNMDLYGAADDGLGRNRLELILRERP